MVAEPMRIDRDPALGAARGSNLVDAVGVHRRPVVHAEPQLRPVCLGMPFADPDVAVEAARGIMADLDGPRLAALATGRDLPAPQVNVTAQRVIRVAADPGQLRQPDAGGREHGDDRAVAALGERPPRAGPLQRCQSSAGEDGNKLLPHRRRPKPRHGVGAVPPRRTTTRRTAAAPGTGCWRRSRCSGPAARPSSAGCPARRPGPGPCAWSRGEDERRRTTGPPRYTCAPSWPTWPQPPGEAGTS